MSRNEVHPQGTMLTMHASENIEKTNMSTVSNSVDSSQVAEMKTKIQELQKDIKNVS